MIQQHYPVQRMWRNRRLDRKQDLVKRYKRLADLHCRIGHKLNVRNQSKVDQEREYRHQYRNNPVADHLRIGCKTHQLEH